jgi:hypothetical protein
MVIPSPPPALANRSVQHPGTVHRAGEKARARAAAVSHMATSGSSQRWLPAALGADLLELRAEAAVNRSQDPAVSQGDIRHWSGTGEVGGACGSIGQI